MRVKNDMITQAIKRWWRKLFAWWPWRDAYHNGYSQTVANVNQGTTQESLWRTTMDDGPLPQPGITSVVIEQERDDLSKDAGRSIIDERPNHLVQHSPPGMEEHTDSSPPLSAKKASEETKSPTTHDAAAAPAPTFEQQMAFLRYLVKRGIINEGFSEGQVPKQYKRKL
jgi:hypothetical protein